MQVRTGIMEYVIQENYYEQQMNSNGDYMNNWLES